jgi:hypothetical protein
LIAPQLLELEKNIHFPPRELIIDEPKVELVEAQALAIDLSSIGAPVTIRTKDNEVVILVRFALRTWDDVVNIDLDVSAGGDSATVAGLHQDPPAQFCRH